MATDPILFQSFPLHDWPWGGTTGSLCIFNAAQWTDINGLVNLANQYQDVAEPLQRCPITVVDRTPTVEAFYYQPTELSIDNPRVRRTGIVYDENDEQHYVLFDGWVFPEEPNPMTWIKFTIFNHCRTLPLPDRYLTYAGGVALLGDPVPAPNGYSAVGIAEIEPSADGGVALVETAHVTADSIILLTPRSRSIIGVPRVPDELIIPGESFTILTTNVGDEGAIQWGIQEPF